MDIVVDTSVLLAVVAGEPSRERAIAVTAGHSLVAPGSVHGGDGRCPVGDDKAASRGQADACIEAYLRIPIRRIEVDLRHTLAMVQQWKIHAYDAYLIAAARQLGSPLLTLDRALGMRATKLGISILEI